MTNREEPEEHKDKRFHVQEDAFVILKPYGSNVGRLIDISIEGLTFEYLAAGRPSSPATGLDIVIPGSAFCLYNVPCKIISDHKTLETPLSSITMGRCGVQFGKLTPSQVTQLKDFIQHYTTREE